jgi:hypothetical protein
MEQNPSWEANSAHSYTASKISHILWNMNVRYFVLKGPPMPYPEPDQYSPHHPALSLKTHFIIILPSVPKYYKWSLSFRLPNQNFICILYFPHVNYMLYPSHSPWFDHLNDIWWRVQIMDLLMKHFSPFSLFLGPNITMLSGSPVTMAWHVLRLQMVEMASRYGG